MMNTVHTKYSHRVHIVLAASLTVGIALYVLYPERLTGDGLVTSSKLKSPVLLAPATSAPEDRAVSQPAPKLEFWQNNKKRPVHQFDRRNIPNRTYRETFLADGRETLEDNLAESQWLVLDPSLLYIQEEELRHQLESILVSDRNIENVAGIAIQASEHHTRIAAIDAIGHRSTRHGRQLLMAIFEILPDEDEQRQALSFIRVESLESAEADWLITQLHEPNIAGPLKREILVKLVLSGLTEHQGDEHFFSELRTRIPPEWQRSQLANLDQLNGNKIGEDYVY